MNTRSIALAISVLAAALTVAAAPTLARADVPPPDTQSCQNIQSGAACKTDDGKAGKCTDSTCSRLDYSDGSPPSSVSYACKKCVAGAAASDGSVNAPPSGGSSSGGGCSLGAGDVGSGLALVGVLLPFVPLVRASRRRRGR